MDRERVPVYRQLRAAFEDHPEDPASYNYFDEEPPAVTATDVISRIRTLLADAPVQMDAFDARFGEHTFVVERADGKRYVIDVDIADNTVFFTHTFTCMYYFCHETAAIVDAVRTILAGDELELYYYKV